MNPTKEEIAYSLAWVDKQDPRPSLSTEHGRYAIILAAAYRGAIRERDNAIRIAAEIADSLDK